MVNALLTLVAQVVNFARTRRQPIAELIGCIALGVALVMWHGAPAGWATAGVALLLKSFDWQLQQQRRADRSSG